MAMPAAPIDEDSYEVSIDNPAEIKALGGVGVNLTSSVLVVANHDNDPNHAPIKIGLVAKLPTVVSSQLLPGDNFPIPRKDAVRIWKWGITGGVAGDKVTVTHGGGWQ
jgi:hypothetical protein